MEDISLGDFEEQWQVIPEFPNYEISNLGTIYNRIKHQTMRTSMNNFGHMKITLTRWDKTRHTRSVAQLVAEAFVSPPTLLCDQIVMLDGDFSNVAAYNLAWRPNGFVWRYTRQLKTFQPTYYKNLPVINTVTGQEYDSIVDAGMQEGLLFQDIWRSTYTGEGIFPQGFAFEILEIIQ